jgi:hypothetical protein
MDRNLLRVISVSIAAEPELEGLEYAQFCEVTGLPETEGGYGVLRCEDTTNGDHWTLFTDDVDYVPVLKSTTTVDPPSDAFEDVELPSDKFERNARGWPEEWGDFGTRSGHGGGA